MSKPKGYVDSQYLSTVATLVNQAKQRSYALMQVQPGHSVLDLGCGPGTDTILLAQMVGSRGQVIGVDYDPSMITEANQRAEQAGVNAWVSHKQADASALPFDAGVFNSSRSERLFQHLLNSDQALAEMIRVTRAGGWVVVFDTDWGTLSVDSTDIDLERRLARVKAEHATHNGFSGRQLYGQFKRHGLTEIHVEIYPYYSTDYATARKLLLFDEVEREAIDTETISNDEQKRWHAGLEEADREGMFFASLNGVMIAGRKVS